MWEMFSTGPEKQLRNVPFILPKPVFTILSTFDYLFLSTNGIYQVLPLFLSDSMPACVRYLLQWMWDICDTWGICDTWDIWDWDKSLENREEKLDYFLIFTLCYLFKEYLVMGKTHLWNYIIVLKAEILWTRSYWNKFV